MGLDASVGCNCYRDGNTKTCPFPNYVRMKEDGYWELYLPDKIEKNKEEALKKFKEFDEWRWTACKHEDMNEIVERIGNYASVRRFKQVLIEVGMDKFKVLIKELSKSHGLTSAELEAECKRN